MNLPDKCVKCGSPNLERGYNDLGWQILMCVVRGDASLGNSLASIRVGWGSSGWINNLGRRVLLRCRFRGYSRQRHVVRLSCLKLSDSFLENLDTPEHLPDGFTIRVVA